MTVVENVPGDYAVWLADLKQRIQSAQQRAVLSVNRERVLLYMRSFAEKCSACNLCNRLLHKLQSTRAVNNKDR